MSGYRCAQIQDSLGHPRSNAAIFNPARDVVDAKKYVSVGESRFDPKLDTIELAAWSQLTAILLNLSETVTRN